MQLVDSQGKLVGIFIPPSLDSKGIESISQSLLKMELVASRFAGEKRGKFKIITFGLQKGPGAKVCYENSANENQLTA